MNTFISYITEFAAHIQLSGQYENQFDFLVNIKPELQGKLFNTLMNLKVTSIFT